MHSLFRQALESLVVYNSKKLVAALHILVIAATILVLGRISRSGTGVVLGATEEVFILARGTKALQLCFYMRTSGTTNGEK
jgi:hypothetical protein